MLSAGFGRLPRHPDADKELLVSSGDLRPSTHGFSPFADTGEAAHPRAGRHPIISVLEAVGYGDGDALSGATRHLDPHGLVRRMLDRVREELLDDPVCGAGQEVRSIGWVVDEDG